MNNSFWEIFTKLQDFWIKKKANPIFPHNQYVGAGTFHPHCFFSSLSNKPSAFVFPQKSTRKADGRYGKSPNRFLNHHQLEVIFTPSPEDIKEMFLESLEYIGIDLNKNLIQINDNNWENISIGAIGVGWEVLCNNTEICQFTYFQKMADLQTSFNTVELAYGLERLAFVLNQQNVYDISWKNDVTYSNLRLQEEIQFCEYFMKHNTVESNDFFKMEPIIDHLININLYLPAYEKLLEMIDVFNSLDAMKKISQIQRKEYIDITRKLASKIASLYIKTLN